MRALIVYESVFGNTREVAEAIEEGIRAADPTADVACIPVTDTGARPVEAPDLLVLGGPTHMGGMSRGFTRSMGLRIESATQKAKRKERLREGQAPLPQSQHHIEPDARGAGIRDWLRGLRKGQEGKAAAFDTRGYSRTAGGAAGGIAKQLRKHGYDLVAGPEGFIVEDMAGPLRAGERERAKQWAAGLV